MLKKIEALRKKPKEVRNRYAFSVALLVTTIILVVWGSTLPARLAPESVEVAAQEKTEESSFQKYKEAFSSLLSRTAEQFSAIVGISDEAATSSSNERIDFVELVASSSRQQENGQPSEATSTSSTTTATSTEVQGDATIEASSSAPQSE